MLCVIMVVKKEKDEEMSQPVYKSNLNDPLFIEN
jgi:hypothetical protein